MANVFMIFRLKAENQNSEFIKYLLLYSLNGYEAGSVIKISVFIDILR